VTRKPYFVADYESEYVWAKGDDYSSEKIADDDRVVERYHSFCLNMCLERVKLKRFISYKHFSWPRSVAGSGAETDLSFSIWKIGREVGEVRHCKKRNGS
jgi:hypothetical protein